MHNDASETDVHDDEMPPNVEGPSHTQQDASQSERENYRRLPYWIGMAMPEYDVMAPRLDAMNPVYYGPTIMSSTFIPPVLSRHVLGSTDLPAQPGLEDEDISDRVGTPPESGHCIVGSSDPYAQPDAKEQDTLDHVGTAPGPIDMTDEEIYALLAAELYGEAGPLPVSPTSVDVPVFLESSCNSPPPTAATFATTRSEYPVFMNSFGDAASAKQHLEKPRWKVTIDQWHDPSWPKADLQWMVWVDRLYTAFVQTDQALDLPGTRYLTMVVDKKWPQKDIEARMWEIVGSAKRLHEVGCSVPAHLEETAVTGSHSKGRRLLIGERLEVIESILAEHKSVCSSVMDGYQVDVLVADPGAIRRKQVRSKSMAVRRTTVSSDAP